MKARLLEVIILIPSQGRSMPSIMKTKAMFYQDRTAEARFTKMISTAKSILTIIPLLMPLIQVQSVDKLTTKIICTRISLSSSKENTILHSTLVWLVANSNRGKSIPSREILDSTTEEAPSFKWLVVASLMEAIAAWRTGLSITKMRKPSKTRGEREGLTCS